jgi:hypothetical protein
VFSKESRSDPPSDNDRRRIRLRTLKFLAVFITVFTAGSMSVETSVPALSLAVPAGDKDVVTYQTNQGNATDNLAVTLFYDTEVGKPLTLSAVNCSVVLLSEAAAPEAEEPKFTENTKIPLSAELQEYLYDLCQERKIDYKMALAIIKHESSFNPKALGGGCNYGLFQINICHHKSLSKNLKTENTPYDPKTNMNWGTYLLSCLYADLSGEYEGEELTKAVLSAYNMGTGGFKKYGFANKYIKGYQKALAEVNTWFDTESA